MRQCADCGKQFSDVLEACPVCGCPASVCSPVVSEPVAAQKPVNDVSNEVELHQQPQQQQSQKIDQIQQTPGQAPIVTMPQPVEPQINNQQKEVTDAFDYSKRRIFYLIAGGIACFGALVVLTSDTMNGVSSIHWGVFFGLLSAGLALIGTGISIKQ